MVGRNFIEYPAAAAFDILAPSSRELDLRNYDAISAYLMRHKPDAIIHAAGRVGGIQANIAQPVRFLLDNLDMGRNVIWAARSCGVKRLINLGSSCMYPRNAPNPLTEEMVLQGELEPTNEGYALAKIATARLCEYIGRENPEFHYKTLIPCNIYGPHDKFDPEHSHMIPAVIHKMHAAKTSGHKEVVIWGDGCARREFMYAGDLADCLVQAVIRLDSLPATMNIGIGMDYSINEYYAAIAQVVGFDGTFVHDLGKPVGMARKLVNIERAEQWGWRARTVLLEGLRKTYAYYREQNNGRN